MIEIIGLLGSLLFAVSSWPQAYKAVFLHTTEGVSVLFMLLLMLGGVCSASYAVLTKQYILLPNYISGASGITVVFICRILERKKNGNR